MARKVTIAVLLGLWLCTGRLEAAPAGKPPAARPVIRVDRKARRIEIDARMAHPDRVLEYLLVLQDEGPAYESLFTTTGTMRRLHQALLALNLAAPDRRGSRFGRGDLRQVHGEKVDLRVVWNQNRKGDKPLSHTLRVEKLLVVNDAATPVAAQGWAFLPYRTGGSDPVPGAVGGEFHSPTYTNLISLIHDPFSVLTHPASREARGEPQIMVSPLAPKPGTAVTLIIEPVSEADLVARALKTQKDKAAIESLQRVQKWAKALDRHRAEWKKYDDRLLRLQVRYARLKKDEKTWKEAQSVFQKIGTLQQERYTARVNVVRSEGEITAESLAGMLRKERRRAKPDAGIVERLAARSAAASKRLALLRLQARREEMNKILVRKREKIESAPREQATKLKDQIDLLSRRAELLDIRINIIQDGERLVQAHLRQEQIQGQIQYLEEAIRNSQEELKTLRAEFKTLGIDPDAPVPLKE